MVVGGGWEDSQKKNRMLIKLRIFKIVYRFLSFIHDVQPVWLFQCTLNCSWQNISSCCAYQCFGTEAAGTATLP
jgi:hypothetical protein